MDTRGQAGLVARGPRSVWSAPYSNAVATRACCPRPKRRNTARSKRFATSSAFTLVELLLVMTVMVMTFAIGLPVVANFFRGRTLDSEARRLLAVTRGAQSRAVSEGAPMQLWVDARKGRYGLQEAAGWTEHDPKAATFKLDADLHIEMVTSGKRSTTTYSPLRGQTPTVSRKKNDLPEIRFLPDGTFDDTTPQGVRLFDRNGLSLWVVPSRNRLNYEIRNEHTP